MRHALLSGLLLALAPARLSAQAQTVPSLEPTRGSTVPFSVATSSPPVTLLSPDPYAGRPVEAIRIEPVNVFDQDVPGEDWWPFRAANRIHYKTREAVIRRELLTQPGQPWDPLSNIQSERNLRSLGLFRRADIRPVERPDGKLDLAVRTQDAWSTIVFFSAGTEGGEHFLSYGASERNLFGRGKQVSFAHKEEPRRRRTEYFYDDPRVLGTRVRLTPYYARTQHGDSFGTRAIRPFFALETPYAAGAAWERTIDELIVFRDAAEHSKFVERRREVYGGWGVRLEPDSPFVQRVEAGWWSQRHVFETTSETVQGTLPADRELSGPLVGYSWTQPRYIKETYVDRMERVEDYNMGNELTAAAGYMARAFASDRDRAIYHILDQQGVYFEPGRFALAQVGATGRLAGSKPENTLLFTNINVFWKTGLLVPQTWVAHLEANRGRNLDRENQIVLGGANGLRGYKNNSFTGSKSVLLNLENRMFLPGEYFHLVRFGATVFFDSGAVEDDRHGISLRRFKSDIGVGLRIASTRSETGGVARIDVAYALNRGPGSYSRWVVSVQGGQAFQIFNSSTKAVRQSPGAQLRMRPRE